MAADSLLAAAVRQTIAMQVSAMGVEPGFGAIVTRAEPLYQPPEARRMVHLDEVRHLVRGEIIEYVARRQNEPPRERQHAGGRARAPAARLIAHCYTFDGDAESLGKFQARGFELAPGLAAQVIADAPVEMRRVAGDAQQSLAVTGYFSPDGATHAAAVCDAVRYAAQRHHDAVGERRRLRQPPEPCGDPAAVLLRERARFLQRAARRDRQNDFARVRLDAQCVAPRLAVPAQLHQINRSVEDDLDRLRLTRATIKQRA